MERLRIVSNEIMQPRKCLLLVMKLLYELAYNDTVESK